MRKTPSTLITTTWILRSILLSAIDIQHLRPIVYWLVVFLDLCAFYYFVSLHLSLAQVVSDWSVYSFNNLVLVVVSVMIIMSVLQKNGFLTNFHCFKPNILSRRAVYTLVIMAFTTLLLLLLLRLPLNAERNLLSLFGMLGYLLVSRLTLSVMFRRYPRVVYFGNHSDNALSVNLARKWYLVCVVRPLSVEAIQNPFELNRLLYSVYTTLSTPHALYRFEHIIIDRSCLHSLNDDEFESIMDSFQQIWVFDDVNCGYKIEDDAAETTSTACLRKLTADELLQRQPCSPIAAGKPTFSVVTDDSEPAKLPVNLLQVSSGPSNKLFFELLAEHAEPTIEPISSQLSSQLQLCRDTAPVVIINDLSVSRLSASQISHLVNEHEQLLKGLSSVSNQHLFIVSRFSQCQYSMVNSLTRWLEYSWRIKLKRAGVDVFAIRMGDLKPRLDDCVNTFRECIQKGNGITLRHPRERLWVHENKSIGKLNELFQMSQTGLNALPRELHLQYTEPTQLLTLAERTALSEGKVLRHDDGFKRHRSQVALTFSYELPANRMSSAPYFGDQIVGAGLPGFATIVETEPSMQECISLFAKLRALSPLTSESEINQLLNPEQQITDNSNVIYPNFEQGPRR